LYHSTLGLRVIKKKKKTDLSQDQLWQTWRSFLSPTRCRRLHRGCATLSVKLATMEAMPPSHRKRARTDAQSPKVGSFSSGATKSQYDAQSPKVNSSCQAAVFKRRLRAGSRRGDCLLETKSGPLRVVHLSRHKWPGGLASAVLSENPFRTLAWKGWDLSFFDLTSTFSLSFFSLFSVHAWLVV